MKGFVVVAVFTLIVACQALSDEEKAKMRKLYTACVEASSANEDLIKKLRAGEDVKDEGVSKYVDCMFTKLGFIKDGAIQVEKLKESIPSDFNKEEATTIIDNCKDTKGETPKDTAVAVYQCFLHKSSKLIDF